MGENKFQVIYNGKVEKETVIPVQEIDRELKDQKKGTNIVRVNEEGTSLMQVRHELLNVGESIAQVKYNTSATTTKRGTIVVSQFKQEITSRGEEVWYYKNSLGTFEGTLAEAQIAFPDVDFSGIKAPTPINNDHPEFKNLKKFPPQPLKWETLNEYDGEKQGGPTNWEKWADATQTALDIVGMVPAVGEIADCINGVISLARGNYADAALSFAAMIPFFGNVITGSKIIKKAKKFKKIVDPEDAKGVYDLIVKNGDDIQGYVGQSKNIFQRFIQHFNPKRGKLTHNVVENGSIIHKMNASTKLEREIYEQYIILEKYGGEISKKGGELKYLLNKVNPVGGRFDLKSPEGLKEFYAKAKKIARKYDLPTEFAKEF
ncbi:MAG: GIY-YIG nuclease family protein [Flavobacteriaceae bacterium]|nr:GIY-YIG nuclease family protein [Flavobacteriaceae bacterium]